MRYLLKAAEMKSCDISTIERFKVPSEVLMERAALAVRDAAINEFHPRKVLVLCGSGNNGGDGFAAARLLLIAGVKADVLFLGKHSHMTDQCRLEEMIFTNYGGITLPDDADLHGYDLIIDALFGIGLSREILGRYADVINAVNRTDTPVLSVDIPSGISADDGQIQGNAVKADVTVTFQYEKLGQKLFPGEEYCGKLIVADVGINEYRAGDEYRTSDVYRAGDKYPAGDDYRAGDEYRTGDKYPASDDYLAGEGFREAAGLMSFSGGQPEQPSGEPVYTLEVSDLPSLLPRRHADDNKGTHGKLLIAAGNSGMAGAAILAAKAAFRSGVGMVCVLTHPDNRLAIQTAVPEAIFAPWPQLEVGSDTASDTTPDAAYVPAADSSQSRNSLSPDGLAAVDRWLSWCDALAVGPGFGTTDQSFALLTYLLRSYTGPMVIDADALNLMAQHPQLSPIGAIPAIITPHPEEMRRLLGAGRKQVSDEAVTHPEGDLTVSDIAAHPIHIASEYARRTGLITVLKGARTVVTDGSEVMLNTLGNEGMATAGSGDTLTGIIGSLLAQRLFPFDAAQTGVLLHALAGDKAAVSVGKRSMKAGDLADFLPEVLNRI